MQPDRNEVESGSGPYELIGIAREEPGLSEVFAYHDALVHAQQTGNVGEFEAIVAKLRCKYEHLSESNAWALLTPDGARIA